MQHCQYLGEASQSTRENIAETVDTRKIWGTSPSEGRSERCMDQERTRRSNKAGAEGSAISFFLTIHVQAQQSPLSYPEEFGERGSRNNNGITAAATYIKVSRDMHTFVFYTENDDHLISRRNFRESEDNVMVTILDQWDQQLLAAARIVHEFPRPVLPRE